MRYTCSKAFDSIEEAHEWTYISTLLEIIDNDVFPIVVTVKHSENIQRLRRHNYVLKNTGTPNVYELFLKHKDK